MKDYKIYLVDQDHDNLQEMVRFLENNSYSVTGTTNGKEAVERLSDRHFDLLITELHMDPLDGLAILKKVKEINPEMMVIILTSDYDLNFAVDALRLGADDYLFKPFAKAELLRGVNHCLDKLGLRRRNSHSIDEQILNMLKVMSQDVKGPLVSMSAILKLLSRGYYGKMDEGVANSLNGLLSKTIGLIGIIEEYRGGILSIEDDAEGDEEVLDFVHVIKTIIQKHGGDIWYEPQENGSNFVFTLPAARRSSEFSY